MKLVSYYQLAQYPPVVGVQADVYEGVDHGWERDGRPGRQVAEVVCEQHHAGVVVHVQDADLTRLVTQQHEHLAAVQRSASIRLASGQPRAHMVSK